MLERFLILNQCVQVLLRYMVITILGLVYEMF